MGSDKLGGLEGGQRGPLVLLSKGKTLGSTSSQELENLAHKLRLPNFRVDPKDMLPDRLSDTATGIVNMDDSSGNGTHWVCYYNKPNSDVIYFDPFGTPIDPSILRFLKSSGMRVMAITNQIQDLKSDDCGYYCLYFLTSMNRGVSVPQFLSQFDFDKQLKNDQILEKFFK